MHLKPVNYSILSILLLFILTQASLVLGQIQTTRAPQSANLAELTKFIIESEYDIQWQEIESALQSPNRAQNLRFTYQSDGFSAERRVKASDQDEWSISLALERYGNATAFQRPVPAQIEVSRRHAIAKGAELSVEYLNDATGMRQNFLVHRRIGHDGNLRLEIGATLRGVQMLLDQEAGTVSFVRNQKEVMLYSDLNVWDSDGSPLEAWFEPIAENQFAIVVDDHDARYPIIIDPLSSYDSATGDQGSCKYGFSIAFGDVNGGQDDLIVGAPYYDNGQTDEGKVFVYHGSSTGFPTTPNWTAESDQAGALFGYSLASGDLNGDDYADVVVGAPGYDTYSVSDDGRTFVWFGSDTTGLGSNGSPGNADWQQSSGQHYGHHGWSVAVAGDVDGNGYNELLVGAPDYDATYTDAGKAFVYHSTSSGPSTTVSWTAVGSQTSAKLGFAVAGAGDVNADGYFDIVIGAPLYDNGQTDEGVALLWYGGSGGLGSNGTPANADRTLEKNQASAQFGYSVAWAGDINGDGYSDIIVGAPLYDNGQTDEGVAFVYHGSATGIPSSENWYAESNQASAQLGFSVASTWDLGAPSDGYYDIVIGAPYYDYAGTSDGGGTFVWYGSYSGLGSNGTPANADYAAYNVTNNGAHGGWSVAGGPNVKYFLHAGFGIGSPDEDGGGLTDRGAVNIFAD